MPSLDVNVVLSDPDLADCFDVRRSTETVGADGRSQGVQDEMILGCLGVIKWDTGMTERSADGAHSPESITISTAFSLRDTSQGYQPDVVIWREAEYTVMKSAPNRHFGEGFTVATCVSTRALDNPAPD